MNLKLFMVMLGCTPDGRNTEQHDVFFGIAASLKELVTAMEDFWPEAKDRLHIDAWREVTSVDGYSIEVAAREETQPSEVSLFFINLGGYKLGEFEEYHYKMLAVAPSMSEATKLSKKTAFYKHCRFDGATSHIDDKYGVDVDDAHLVEDILAPDIKAQFRLKIIKKESDLEDQLNIGYLKIEKLLKS